MGGAEGKGKRDWKKMKKKNPEVLTGNDGNNLNIIADVEIVNDNELYLNTCLFKKKEK